MCDGAILVVRCGDTSKQIIKESMQQLDQVGCKLLGVVLNRVEASARSYKYYGKYGQYYAYQSE
jgi:Mrp family chromosome partitioning ATPase